jgi:hypothetical protein
MARQSVRSFSSAGRLSPRLVGTVVAIVGAVAVTAAVAARGRTNAEAGQAAQAAKKILYAAGAYAAASAQAGCPTITELMEAHSLDDDARVEDAWGNRYRIVCDDSGARVISSGPDGRPGTKDDVRFTR